MRLALISDLHGNELAVRAVLDDVRARGVDVIACLGDVATLGPRPREVLALVRELDGPKHPRQPRRLHARPRADPPLHRGSDHRLGGRLVPRTSSRPRDLDTIRGFEATHELVVDDATTVLLFHGTPRSNMEDLLATTPDADVDEMLGGRRATVMAGGHTHLPMVRRHRGAVLVNPGSVGLPFARHPSGGGAGDPGPRVVRDRRRRRRRGPDVELVRLDLDRRALAAQAADSACPLAPDAGGGLRVTAAGIDRRAAARVGTGMPLRLRWFGLVICAALAGACGSAQRGPTGGPTPPPTAGSGSGSGVVDPQLGCTLHPGDDPKACAGAPGELRDGPAAGVQRRRAAARGAAGPTRTGRAGASASGPTRGALAPEVRADWGPRPAAPWPRSQRERHRRGAGRRAGASSPCCAGRRCCRRAATRARRSAPRARYRACGRRCRRSASPRAARPARRPRPSWSRTGSCR